MLISSTMNHHDAKVPLLSLSRSLLLLVRRQLQILHRNGNHVLCIQASTYFSSTVRSECRKTKLLRLKENSVCPIYTTPRPLICPQYREGQWNIYFVAHHQYFHVA